MTIHGNVKPSVIEQQGFVEEILAHRMMAYPENFQMRVAYNANNDPLYIGFAQSGVAEGATNKWLIQYYEYDGSNRVTSRTTDIHDWTDRANGTYT